jgi:hypothetical protein
MVAGAHAQMIWRRGSLATPMVGGDDVRIRERDDATCAAPRPTPEPHSEHDHHDHDGDVPPEIATT